MWPLAAKQCVRKNVDLKRSCVGTAWSLYIRLILCLRDITICLEHTPEHVSLRCLRRYSGPPGYWIFFFLELMKKHWDEEVAWLTGITRCRSYPRVSYGNFILYRILLSLVPRSNQQQRVIRGSLCPLWTRVASLFDIRPLIDAFCLNLVSTESNNAWPKRLTFSLNITQKEQLAARWDIRHIILEGWSILQGSYHQLAWLVVLKAFAC